MALLLIMVLLVFSALAGGLAVRGAASDLQMSAGQRINRTSFYCAEAGLNAARPILSSVYGQWNSIFSTNAATGITYPVTGDLDGDGLPDYSVTLSDNIDEFPTNNPLVDSDLTAVLTSVCVSKTLANASNRTLKQVVTYSGSLGTDYRFQAGHSSTHSGNVN